MNNDLIHINTLPPFKRMCVSIGNLPSSFMESMTYYEALEWLYKYLADTIIPTVNNTGEAVTELQAAFITLKDYVDNYFENLDVQEEINNKLDEMAESGQLTDIIAQYLGLAGVLAFSTVADMKSAENLVNGSTAHTLGFHSLNDGGGSSYKIRTITNEDIVNEMDIIALSDNTLIAELIYEYPINPKKLGAYGDGTHDDITPIQKALSIGNVKFSKGSYKLSQSINLNSNTIIDGNDCTLIPDSEIYAIKVEGNGINNPKTQINIKNFNISLTNGGNGINLKDSYFVYIDNINIRDLNANNLIGFKITNGFNHVISNSRVLGNTSYTGQIGLDISSTNINNAIENMTNCKYDTLLLQGLDYGVKANYLTTCNVVEFNNIGFTNNSYHYYFTGYGQPIVINNSRMEKGTGSNNQYGFYINGTFNININNLNAYNIGKVIHNSGSSLTLNGNISLTGSNQNPKYSFIEYTNRIITSNAYIYFLSDTYNIRATDAFDGGYIKTNVYGHEYNIDTNTINISPVKKDLYKTTANVSYLYGYIGAECYVYTELSDKIISVFGNSKLKGENIPMIPYKVYHIVMLEDNGWTLLD